MRLENFVRERLYLRIFIFEWRVRIVAHNFRAVRVSRAKNIFGYLRMRIHKNFLEAREFRVFVIAFFYRIYTPISRCLVFAYQVGVSHPVVAVVAESRVEVKHRPAAKFHKLQTLYGVFYSVVGALSSGVAEDYAVKDNLPKRHELSGHRESFSIEQRKMYVEAEILAAATK